MDNIKTITAAVSEDMADRLHAAVESGDYATTGEIVREALDKWAEDEDYRERKLKELRAAIAEGEKGPFLDGEQVLAELRDYVAQLVEPRLREAG